MGELGFVELFAKVKPSPIDGIIMQEPTQEMGPSSASVPIPGGHRGTRGVYDQLSPSPLESMWLNRSDHIKSPFKVDSEQLDDIFNTEKCEDDDILKVDKASLIQGPTLAELIANDDTLLGDLNFDGLFLPEERIQPFEMDINAVQTDTPYYSDNNVAFASSSFPQSGSTCRNICPAYVNTHGFNLNINNNVYDNLETVNPNTIPSPGTSNIAGNSTVSSSTSPHPINNPDGQSALHELLMGRCENSFDNSTHGNMDIGCTNNKHMVSRLSMSAPTRTMGLEQIWAFRESRPHLLSTGSLGVVEAGSTSGLSTGGALSPDLLYHIDHLSHDEGYEASDDDSDHCDDYSSDSDTGGSDGEDQNSGSRIGSGSVDSNRESKHSKKERYFWQYNVETKGPKGQRLITRTPLEDPHVLNEATDPVFSPHYALPGIKHSGRARKGDGNDLTPNPRKLYSIGCKLEKLSRIINDMTPLSELPFAARPTTRKEKNKFSSQVCRLKKKAQHEANKIILHGLEQEHKRLIHSISQAKMTLAAKLREPNSENQEKLTCQMDNCCNMATKIRIANHSTEFVKEVVDKVRAGVPDGGIDDF